MGKREYERNNTTIWITKTVINVHPVVESIANNLAEIDIIKYIKITPTLLQASSETTAGRNKIPVTKPEHPTAVGVSLITDVDRGEIQFYEMTSAVKGYGEKMVRAVLNGLPESWEAVVVMDWSGGFWDRMNVKYDRIELV